MEHMQKVIRSSFKHLLRIPVRSLCRRSRLFSSFFSSSSSSSFPCRHMKSLSQKDAQLLDSELMSPHYGFSEAQLMELAGLSCAVAVTKLPSLENIAPSTLQNRNRVLVICGPGNNGGDGLVCARHLVHFGFRCSLLYPKQKEGFMQNLLLQCTSLGIDILSDMPSSSSIDRDFVVVVDAIFGFSFTGTSIREPFKTIIETLNQCKVSSVVSLDIPSGWDVDKGDLGFGLKKCDMLVSLSIPKRCAETFKGIHYLGGRFVPPSLLKKFNITVPEFPDSQQLVLMKW